MISTKQCSVALSAAVLATALWSPLHASEDADLQSLVDEIEQLAEKARQERAADRWLQIALEDIVAKYNFPWRDSLLSDSFNDGDYRQNPAWTVDSGEFWVDRRLGLRSQVTARQVQPQQQPEARRQTEEDLGRTLIGALFQEALGTRDNREPAPAAVPVETQTVPASIRTALEIPTTFAVESLFSQNNRPGEAGRFEWLVMQDEQASNAYRLVVTTGDKPMLDVISIRNGRESYLESATIPAINEGGEHALSWRQTGNGQIQVFLDGSQVITTSDRPFRYGFKYLGMINRNGDFSVTGIEVLGGR